MHSLDRLITVTALTALFGAGCASPYQTQTATWGQVDDETRGSTAKVAKGETGPNMTAKEMATSFKTSAECEDAARAQYEKNPRHGLALLGACLKRSDSTVLDVFWNDPWAKLFKDPHRFLQIARVVANRGGAVATDLPTMQAQRVPLFGVQQSLEAEKPPTGRIILARVLYIRTDTERPDLRVYEESRVDQVAAAEQPTAEGKVPSVGEPTGRMLLVEPRRGEEIPGVEEEYILVAEVTGKLARFNEETGQDEEFLSVTTLGRLKAYAYLR